MESTTQMRSATPPAFQFKSDNETEAGGIGAPVQLSTTIVDDVSDPANNPAMGGAPGQGRGVLAHSDGSVNTDVQFGPLLNDCGTYMNAFIIPSMYSGGIDDAGTAPKSGTWPNWWSAVAPAPNNYWVRGHLLNHNVGGPGEKRNLTPITKTANSEHHNNIEKAVKWANENGGGLVTYTVKAVYDGKGPQNLKGDKTDPDSSCWPKLTTGFQCDFLIQDDDGNSINTASFFVENKR